MTWMLHVVKKSSDIHQAKPLTQAHEWKKNEKWWYGGVGGNSNAFFLPTFFRVLVDWIALE